MRFLTIADAADQLGMGHSGVLANITRGSLRAERIGVQWLILPEDLEKFVEKRKARFGGRVKMHAGSPGPPKRPKRAVA